MALTVTLNGTDEAAHLREGSLRITRTNGDRPGRCDFTLVDGPKIGVVAQTLVIADGATTYFDGETRGYRVREWTTGHYFTEVWALDDGAVPTAAAAPFALSDVSPADTYALVINGIVPTSWWRLGEPSGTNAVDEMLEVDGTYVDTPTLGVTGSMTTDTDTAITLNGTSEYVTVGSYRLAGQTNFLIAAWAKSSGSGLQTIYSERAAAGGNPLLQFHLNASGRPTLQARDNAGTLETLVPVSGDWTDGAWHHFAAVKNDQEASVYVDGFLEAYTANFIQSTTSGTLLARIGAEAFDGSYLNGSIDEVMVWNDFDTNNFHPWTLYHAKDIRRYKDLDLDYVTDSGMVTEVTSGRVSTLTAGLVANQTIAITSSNLGLVMEPYTVEEVTIRWLDTTPLYTATYGDAPLHLAAAFP